MALPRVCMLSRSLLSRGSTTRVASSAFRSSKVAIAIPQRQFASVSRLRQETVQDQSARSQSSVPPNDIPEAQRSKNARSVLMTKVPKQSTIAQVRALFAENNLELLDIELRMDRFTFYNNCNAFVELANEEQAERAVQLLQSNESLGKQLYVKRLGPEYQWGLDNGKKYELGHTVLINDAGIEAAIQPILDGRRLVFSVLPPAWADLDAPIKIRNDINRDILVRTLKPFGLESHSPISPNWGDKKQNPRYLCFVDMKTKQGADEAMRKLHDTTVKGLKVGLEQSRMAPWKAYQLGKADKKMLELLQKKGLAPPPEEIDEEQYSQPFVRKAPRGARR